MPEGEHSEVEKNHTLKGTIGSAINQDGDNAVRLCIALKLSGTYQKPKQKNKPNVILESRYTDKTVHSKQHSFI